MDEPTSSIIRAIPPLIVWMFGLILSIKMLRRGGSSPEKLFVAGCSLMLFKTIISPLPRVFIEAWMNQEDLSIVSVAGRMAMISIPTALISLAGFICLVGAFWKKFKAERPEAV